MDFLMQPMAAAACCAISIAVTNNMLHLMADACKSMSLLEACALKQQQHSGMYMLVYLSNCMHL